MYPISYTRHKNVVTFQYDEKEYKEWEDLGYLEGNVGQILDKIDYDSRMMSYKGFGTIENPFKHIATIDIINFPLFDGELREPEKYLKFYIEEQYRLNPPTTFVRLEIIDISKYNNESNIIKIKK